MSDTIATSADGRFRVVLDFDEYAVNPRTWAESLTGALTVPDRQYHDVPESGPLADEWRRLMSTYGPSYVTGNRGQTDRGIEIMERYIRVCHGGVSAVHSPHNGPSALFYVLPDMMRGAGFTDDDATSTERQTEALQGELQEYRRYVDGEVYVIRVEELQTWSRAATDAECVAWTAGHLSGDEWVETDHGLMLTRDEWETIDSLAQVIGDDYAREEGMQMLANAVGVTVRPAAFASGNAVATGVTCPGCDQEITVTDTSKTECGGEGEGACTVADGDAGTLERFRAAQLAHQHAADVAAPFLD